MSLSKKKWVRPGIATISDNPLHCKEYIITEYVVWRILKWITSACPSFISIKNCSSHSEFILPSVSHQVSAQEDMVWKMMFEEFHDSCSMLDPLWHHNGIISAFLCNLSACCLPSSFCSRGCIVWKKMMFEEFQDGCLVLGNLSYANGMILATSESPCCRKLSIKFLLKRIYGLELMMFEEFNDSCLVQGNLSYANGMILAIFESPCC